MSKLDVVGGATLVSGRLIPIVADKGDPGPKGDTVEGNDGWTPVLAGELDGVRTLIKVADWVGGEGNKPQTGMYIGTTGYVSTKAAAFNFNASKRVMVFSGATVTGGIATIDYSAMGFTNVPAVRALPATGSVLSGPSRSTVSNITTSNCKVTVDQQSLVTGLFALLVGATANVLVIEQ